MSGSGEPRRVGATLDRSIILSQLLFGVALVVAYFLLRLLAPENVTSALATTGLALAFAVTIAVVLVPWQSLPRWTVMLVPILDIVVIGLMRLGDPSSGFGLLWVFPTIWLSSFFGLTGAAIAIVASSGFTWWSEIAGGRVFTPASIPSIVLLPIALLFIAVSSVLSAKRTNAQRTLLRNQARQLERALRTARRQEQQLAELLNAVDFGVVRLDVSGRDSVTNAAYLRMYGLAPTATAADHDGVAFAADRSTPLLPEELPYARAVRGEAFDNELMWVSDGADGLRAISVTARALHDDDGELDGGVLVARDVTPELRAIRARDDLMSSVSHELRTPMTSVLGYVELSLDDPELSPTVRRNLEIMERNGERMLTLIATILEGAKDADAPMRLKLEEAGLDVIVRDAVEGLEPRAAERGIRLEMTTVEPVTARVDAVRIRQVLDNLLSNAIKYNRTDGMVGIGLTADAGRAWIVVRDTGLGIPESEVPRVFDRYFRSERVRRGSEHGNGLGLGIARDLIERHGGTIDLHSEEGSGTTVIVTLPVSATNSPSTGDA